VVGAALCFAITPALARLTRIPFAIIAAPVVIVMVIGAYQSTSTFGDIFMLLALGVLGWMMKHAAWPRAPALVGFVLSGPLEQYFWLTNQIHGWSWLWRPGVLVIASLILIPLAWQGVRAVREIRARRAAVAAGASQEERQGPTDEDAEADTSAYTPVALALAAFATVAFAYAAWEMTTYNPASRLMAALAVVPGLPLAAWLAVRGFREIDTRRMVPEGELPVLLVLLLYGAAIFAVGFTVPTVALLAWMLIARAKMRWWTAAIYGAIVLAAALFLFDMLRGDAPTGVLIPLS
jgi:hypothetical protein